MPKIDKYDIENWIQNFKITIENSYDIPNKTENIIELAFNGVLGVNYLRSTGWKILLNYFSSDSESSIYNRVDEKKEKWQLYHKKIKELTSLNKFSGVPLEANIKI